MKTMVCDLSAKSCKPCEGGVPPLDADETERLLQGLDGWQIAGSELIKNFGFRNFHETMAFVNALAWISHRENHHPDLEVSYKQCRVRYSTHAIGGLSENDFICAAKTDALLARTPE